jgi:hypothetical protein
MYNITKKLCILVYPNVNIERFINPYFKELTYTIKHHGIIHAVKLFKMSRLHITRVICNQPLYVNDLMIGIDKTGWPKRLAFLKPLLHGTTEEKKLLFTILLLSRTLKVKGKEKQKLIPDYSTIVDKPKGNYIIPTGFIKQFVKQFKLHCKSPGLHKDYLCNKAGPVGPSTLTALDTLLNYSYPELDKMFKLTDSEGNKYLEKQYKLAWDKGYKSNKTYNSIIGKLSFIYDPECKLRIIAIVDYYTQLFLRPINDSLFKIIKHMDCDRTFTQNPRHAWIDNSESF